MSGPKSKVQLEHRDALCVWHGEPLREEWPKGYEIIVPTLFGFFAELPDIVDYTQGSAERLQAAVAEFGPMCCAVSAEKMLAAYREARIGKVGICERCNVGRLGTAFRTKQGKEVKTWRHLCLDCVVSRFMVGPPV